jgi:microbial collagenase
MAKKGENKVEVEGSKTPVKTDSGDNKKKIIVIAVVVIVIIAVLAYVLLQGDENGNGNGNNGNGNHPPSGEIVMTQEDFFVNKLIYFNSTTIDLDNDELTYKWEFGDGDSSNKANTTHTYDLAGTYNVTFTVTDEHDEDDIDTITIEVKDVPETQLSVQSFEPPLFPKEYTVTVDSITNTVSTELVHFYILDGNSQSVKLEGNVEDYEAPHTLQYVYYTDADANGNLSAGDTFLIADDTMQTKGIVDGDIFRLTMEESDDLIGEVTLE